MLFLKQNSVVTGLLSLSLSFVLLGCSGNGSSSENNEETADPVLLNVGIGAFNGGSVLVETFVDQAGWVDGVSIEPDANNEFDYSSLSFDSDTWYRFTLTGGTFLDSNLDSVQDDSSDLQGQLRAIASGEMLNENEGLHIGFASETAYTHIAADLINDSVDWSAIEASLNEFAEDMLLSDMDEDGSIDYTDVMLMPTDSFDAFNLLDQLAAQSMLKIVAAGQSSLYNWMPYSARTMLHEDAGSIYDLVASSDGKKLYGASYREGLVIADIESMVVEEISTGNNAHDAVALNEAAQKVYINNARSNGVYVYDLPNESFDTSILTDIRTMALDVNSSGTTLYVGSTDSFYIYDIENETKTSVSTDYVHSVRLSDDEQYLFVTGNDFGAKYDLVAGEFEFYYDVDSTVYSMLVNNENSVAYFANSSDGLTVVDVSTGAYSSFEAPDGDEVFDVYPIWDEGLLLVTSESGNYTFDINAEEYVDGRFDEEGFDGNYATVYNLDNGLIYFGYQLEISGRYTGIDREVLVDDVSGNLIESVFYNEVTNEVLYGIYNETLGIYDPSTDTSTYVALSGPPNQVTLSSDEQTYIVATTDAGIDLVNASTKALVNISETTNYVEVLEHISLKRYYALDYSDRNIDVYDMTTNSLIGTLDMNGCSSNDIEFNSAQDYLYVACWDNARRYHIGSETWESFDTGYATSLKLSTDEKRLFVSQYGSVFVLDIASDTVTLTLESDHTLFGLTEDESKGLLYGGGNNGIVMFDLSTGDAYPLTERYGNRFAITPEKDAIYYGGGNDGFFKIDLSAL